MHPTLRRAWTDLQLRRMASSTKPIMLGPWRSEVGFESLYWLPFIRYAARAHGIPADRFVTVTRGGARTLYGTRGIDLYQLRSVDAVRLENQYDWEQTGLQKQMRLTDWDRTVLREAAAQVLGRTERYLTLHPSLMYWALEPFWEEQAGTQHLAALTDYQLIPKPKRVEVELPAHYVAVKFYDRATFPGRDPAVQHWVRDLVSVLGAQTPIVLLSGTPGVDDHADIHVEHPSIVSLPAVDPTENLAQQIAVIAHAEAFVGTYGGLAQLALRMGIPSASFYSQWGGTAHAHLALSSWLSKRTKTPFLAGSLDDGAAWRRLLSLPMAAA